MRHSEDLLGILGDQVLEEEVKQRLLALGEDRVDEKREAVAAFNNKVRHSRGSCAVHASYNQDS